MKERIIAVSAISAIILSSCANQKEAPIETEVSVSASVTAEESVTTASTATETTISETTVSVEESTELWLKNGTGIVYDEASSAAASVSIDGADITIKMGDKTISGIFCPCRNGSIDPDKDKHGYYKNRKLPCSYFIMTDEGQVSIEFDSYTLYSSRFNEWYKNG